MDLTVGRINKFVLKYYPFILFFALMFIMHMIMGFNGDDVKFSKVLSNQTLAGYISYRYYNWSSRLVIESILVVLTRQNMFLWKILDCVIYTLGVYYAIKLINRKNSTHIAFLGILLFLMYPFHEMASAGWIATTLNYLWCFSLAMIAFVPLINQFYGEKTNKFTYVISILALIFAVNQEQSCALVFGLNFLLLVYCIIKRKSLNRYNIFVVLISLLSMVFILSCPGNSVRFASEVSYWYPQFAGYGILEKVYLGVVPTFGLLLEEKIIFPLFYVILSLACLAKVKNKYLKYVLYFNMLLILVLVAFKTLFDVSTLGTAFGSTTLTHLTSPFGAVLNLVPPLKSALVAFAAETVSSNALAIAIAVYLLLSSCIMLFEAFGGFKAVILFIAGFMSKFIMGFTPTIFVSGPRTMMFFYFILIMLILMIISRLYDEDKINAKWDRWMALSFIVLAGLNYLFVFAIVFVKYGLF